MRGLLRYAPVKGQFQPDEEALDFDYPNYTDKGEPNNPSGKKVSRSQNGGLDHQDRFISHRRAAEGGRRRHVGSVARGREQVDGRNADDE